MRRTTQSDVARAAGVSRATVSYILNGQDHGRIPISEETRLRVEKAIEELQYEPDARAQALSSGETHTIGLIIADLRNPHFSEYAAGIEQEAHSAGYHVLLSSIELNVDYAVSILKGLARRRIDGLILATSFVGVSEEAQKTLAELRNRKFPIVEVPVADIEEVDCLISNYQDATKEVMLHLLSLQHRRIGLIYGCAAPELADDRLLPYQETLLDAGLFDPNLVAHCGPTTEDGYQAALQLLQLPSRPTALVAINDLLAIGVLRAAADLGLRVPADLSLVGYDDIPIAQYLAPRLTTVSKDAFHLGQEAARVLLARIQDPDRPRQSKVSHPRLIIRESTGPAPALPAPQEAKTPERR